MDWSVIMYFLSETNATEKYFLLEMLKLIILASLLLHTNCGWFPYRTKNLQKDSIPE